MKSLAKSSWAALAAAAALAACQTPPVANADLDAARAAMSQLQADPAAARGASVEIERATQALRQAEAAVAGRAGADDVKHLAYLARRRAEVAQAVVSQARNEARVGQASAERERIRLEARTREAEAAAARARAAQASAQSAQANAQTAQATARTAQGEAAEQAQRAAALERDLQALQAKSTQRGLVVTMGDVLFATGRAELQPGALRNVQQLAAVLRQYPERRVLIEGFTDSVGAEQMNLALSQRRAEAFRQALVSAGIPAERMEVRAHGEDLPVADNSTPAGRQQNRRVEVLFSDPQGGFAAR